MKSLDEQVNIDNLYHFTVDKDAADTFETYLNLNANKVIKEVRDKNYWIRLVE
jgi:hypothetical protein